MILLHLSGALVSAIARCDSKHTDIITKPYIVWRHIIGKRLIRNPRLFRCLLTQIMPNHQRLATSLITIKMNIIALALRRPKTNRCMRFDPAPGQDALEHLLSIGKKLLCGVAHHRILQDGWVRTMQVPGLKKGLPVDIGHKTCQIKILKMSKANVFRLVRLKVRPVDARCITASLRQAD